MTDRFDPSGGAGEAARDREEQVGEAVQEPHQLSPSSTRFALCITEALLSPQKGAAETPGDATSCIAPSCRDVRLQELSTISR